MSVQYVTKETLEQMRAELQRMKSVDRPAASRAIAEAREKGDLKENAEYDAAKEAQGILEAKIAALVSGVDIFEFFLILSQQRFSLVWGVVIFFP